MLLITYEISRICIVNAWTESFSVPASYIKEIIERIRIVWGITWFARHYSDLSQIIGWLHLQSIANCLYYYLLVISDIALFVLCSDLTERNKPQSIKNIKCKSYKYLNAFLIKINISNDILILKLNTGWIIKESQRSSYNVYYFSTSKIKLKIRLFS